MQFQLEVISFDLSPEVKIACDGPTAEIKHPMFERLQVKYSSKRTACVHLFNHSFIKSFFHSFIKSFFHSFIHSFIHPFIHSFIHPFIHLFIHSFSSRYVRFETISTSQAQRKSAIYVLERFLGISENLDEPSCRGYYLLLLLSCVCVRACPCVSVSEREQNESASTRTIAKAKAREPEPEIETIEA